MEAVFSGIAAEQPEEEQGIQPHLNDELFKSQKNTYTISLSIALAFETVVSYGQNWKLDVCPIWGFGLF